MCGFLLVFSASEVLFCGVSGCGYLFFMFIGEHPIRLDAKNRITMPARYRDDLRAMCGGDMNITLHPDGYLLLFPRPRWMAFAQGLISAQQDMGWLKRVFLGSAAELTMDGSGRLALPAVLADNDMVALGKEVQLLGVGDYFELWGAQKRQSALEESLARWKQATTASPQVQEERDRESISRLLL